MTNQVELIDSKLEELVTAERIRRIDEVLSARTTSLTIVLDDVRNGHNISAVLRSADTFGLVDIHLVGDTPVDFSNGISLGSERWMRLVQHKTSSDAINHLKSNGFEIAVLQADSISKRYNKLSINVCELPFHKKLALVFGNEHRGLSEDFLQAADYFSHISMFGFAESLNISVACAICLFLSTVKKTTPEKQTKELSLEEKKELRRAWLVHSIPQGEKVLSEIKTRIKLGRKSEIGRL